MRRQFRTGEFPSILGLRENERVEFKAAQGKDGRGAIPEALWESYVAFANTRGGVIILGVEEHDHDTLELTGVKEPARLIEELWQALDDPRVVSANILSPRDIFVVEQGGVSLVVVRVPSAPREARPIFKGGDPLTGSYVRLSESDYRVDPHVALGAFHIAQNDSMHEALGLIRERLDQLQEALDDEDGE